MLLFSRIFLFSCMFMFVSWFIWCMAYESTNHSCHFVITIPSNNTYSPWCTNVDELTISKQFWKCICGFLHPGCLQPTDQHIGRTTTAIIGLLSNQPSLSAVIIINWLRLQYPSLWSIIGLGLTWLSWRIIITKAHHHRSTIIINHYRLSLIIMFKHVGKYP